MNYDWWKIFYEIACAKSISKASDILHISQPALTKQIQNLENYLNSKLFIRTQKGVLLTSVGERILKDVKNGLNALELAEKKINSLNNLTEGTIRLGISTTLAKSFLMPYIRAFHQKHSKIVFEISTDPTSTLKKELKRGHLDFIIAKFPLKINDDLEYIKINYLHDIFIVSKDYQELINKSVSLQELANYPILLQKQPSSSRDYIEDYCSKNNIKLKSIMEIASSNLLIDFAKIGYGIGVVTKEYVQKELEKEELFEINIEPQIKKREFGIIMLKDNYLSKSSNEFINTLINENNAKETSSTDSYS